MSFIKSWQKVQVDPSRPVPPDQLTILLQAQSRRHRVAPQFRHQLPKRQMLGRLLEVPSVALHSSQYWGYSFSSFSDINLPLPSLCPSTLKRTIPSIHLLRRLNSPRLQLHLCPLGLHRHTQLWPPTRSQSTTLIAPWPQVQRIRGVHWRTSELQKCDKKPSPWFLIGAAFASKALTSRGYSAGAPENLQQFPHPNHRHRSFLSVQYFHIVTFYDLMMINECPPSDIT